MEHIHESLSTGGSDTEPQQDNRLSPPRDRDSSVSPLSSLTLSSSSSSSSSSSPVSSSSSSPVSSSSSSPVSQPVPVASTRADSHVIHKACNYCRDIKPVSEFMKPGAANAFKLCNRCRQARTAVRPLSATW